MPIVNIQVTRDGVTKEQKQQLIKGVTQLLQDVLNKEAHLTHVIIQEISTEDWGVAGEQVAELRKKGKI
ncbi:4-oxalocrotonate tautomerase family protein [Dysgonomonas sp. HDW5A]|uniref:tautomerase family protein n=1 Tax=Dysgonomonas sp. HDW5A TaxID=2714926 RepID=UPI00140AC0F3|nr:4-oxalocrotonate tautomerase family protein [Dysgonomonas sp. HDW5A]QIK59179.1 4-oxalocrotonate tautomerase family protein [Dysgonomonas sp. HDW5A]